VEAVEVDVPAHAHRTFHHEVWARIPKCGARTRSGRPCLGLIVRGKRRCRMHGGARGSGAQPGNRNRWVHGRYSRDQKEAHALMQLRDAAYKLIDAQMAMIGSVARGEDQQFNEAMQTVEKRSETLRRVSASLQESLGKKGWIGDVHELASQALSLLTSPTPGDEMMKEQRNGC